MKTVRNLECFLAPPGGGLAEVRGWSGAGAGRRWGTSDALRRAALAERLEPNVTSDLSLLGGPWPGYVYDTSD